jgi:uncharacterized protein YndB with AHSA1/START domain
MIRKSILLRCPPDEAFELFTGRISEWWPATHRPTKDPASELFIEPAGRFFERARDGREIELGRVVLWQAPRRIELDFYVGTSAAQPTAVNVTFAAEDKGTRVTVHHRAGPASEELWKGRAPLFEKSWEAVLAALVDL